MTSVDERRPELSVAFVFQEQRIEREIKVLREKHVEEEKSRRRAQVRPFDFSAKLTELLCDLFSV